MIGLDTNILLRLVLKDDENALKKAVNLINSTDKTFFISIIVMVELIWNLEKGYKYTKSEIMAVLEGFASIQNFVIEYEPQINAALKRYGNSKAGLVDILIGEVSQLYGCTKTLTFDKDTAKLDAFDLL